MRLAERFLQMSKEKEHVVPTEDELYAREVLLEKIETLALKGEVAGLFLTKDVEGKGYNIRAYLTREGFTLIDMPQKRVYILWNC